MIGILQTKQMLTMFLVVVLMIGTFGSLSVDAQRRYSSHYNHRDRHTAARGALIGGAVGLVGGALVGGRKGALIGAGAGAGTGYLIQRHRIRSRHRHFYGSHYRRR